MSVYAGGMVIGWLGILFVIVRDISQRGDE